METGQLIERRRADALAALIEPGKRRREAATTTAELDHQLRPLIAEAVALGCPYRRIQELTGLSIDTIGRWARTGEVA
jgi:uncharacterized protein YerC